MIRKTKIIATIGPASGDLQTIAKMAAAGMNVARINFSHGDHETHKETIRMVRAAEKIAKKPIGILADLGGPKIRIGSLAGGVPIKLKEGDKITFAPEITRKEGDIPLTYPLLHKDVKAGDLLLLDDGKIAVEATGVEGDRIKTVVTCGGTLLEHKGINLPGVALSTSAITDKDVLDLKFALANRVDFVGISFVQRVQDIETVRKVMQKEGRFIPVVAKIERQTALQNLESIIDASDGIMIARGDLGVETPLEDVPVTQKNIIAAARKFKKPVIVATQMLESMIENDRPTRAEASDVANSVFDGTDIVMLSGETAMGHNPVRAIETMSRIVCAAENSVYQRVGTYDPDDGDDSIVVATTRAACFAAEEAKAKAICIFTMTGKSALYVSKQRPDVNTIAISSSDETIRRLAILFGVTPLKIPQWRKIDGMLATGISALLSNKLVKKGDKIVTVCGMNTTAGATNMIKILTV